METIDHNLELIYLSKRYTVDRNHDCSYYSVSDEESSLGAVYDVSDGRWTYGITGVYNCSTDFIEVPIDSMNELVKFTRLLTTDS